MARGVVTSPTFVRLKVIPLERDVKAGDLVTVVVQVEADARIRLALQFDSLAFDLVSPSSELEVEPGPHEVEWTLYARPTASGASAVGVRAYHGGHFVQAAETPLRIYADGEKR